MKKRARTKKFVYVHISNLEDDVRIMSVSSSLASAMGKAAEFMKRHKFDEDYKFHAIEKWEINSEIEIPDEVWEYERTRVNEPKRWVSSKEKGNYGYEKAV
jgi:hypothetical protein